MNCIYLTISKLRDVVRKNVVCHSPHYQRNVVFDPALLSLMLRDN